jgi:dipeptidyl aminopeptidase/acylaminoacyl peptidase
LDDNEFYTRYSITYKSEGLKISGIMNVPKGKGPFPVLILNHGFIEPNFYSNGQGLKREQDFLARNGYVVLHSDYRNHAQSDSDPAADVRPRSGYVEDVLNAVSAVKNSSFDFLDKENIGMLGHSMGGGIALNVMVTKPEAVKAVVLLAPINSSYKVNFDKWVATEMSETAQKFYALYGRYEENPEVWESFSARNYFSKVKVPVLLHQGTLDQDVPVEWSRELAELLKNEGKEIIYYEYPGEPHTFINAQPLVMQRTLEFFDARLKK